MLASMYVGNKTPLPRYMATSELIVRAAERLRGLNPRDAFEQKLGTRLRLPLTMERLVSHRSV